MDNLEIGQQAELVACHFLEKKGLKLLAKNYRCKLGEIDLIMLDQNDVVFVEVRARSSDDFGGAVESVTKTKQRKVIKTATHFLLAQKWLDKVECRFDIIGITQNQIDWIKDAFSADDFY